MSYRQYIRYLFFFFFFRVYFNIKPKKFSMYIRMSCRKYENKQIKYFRKKYNLTPRLANYTAFYAQREKN
jgi:hypothetical protein